MDSFKVFSEDKLPDMNFLVLEKKFGIRLK